MKGGTGELLRYVEKELGVTIGLKTRHCSLTVSFSYLLKLRNMLLLQHNSQVPLYGIVHYVDIIASTTFKLV